MEYFLILACSLVLLLLHYYLSTRQHWAFGAIVPILYLALLVWLTIATKSSINIRFCFGFVILLAIWCEGRSQVKRKLLQELDKMKSKDIA